VVGVIMRVMRMVVMDVEAFSGVGEG